MQISAVYPGSFDPFTLGHLDIVRRAVALFGHIRIAVVHNPNKESNADFAGRCDAILKATRAAGIRESSVTVDSLSSGLLVDYCLENSLNLIVKGIRNSSDVEYEFPMASVNRDLRGIETVFLPASPEVAHISSSLVRQVAALGGDVEKYLPPEISASFRG